MCNNSLSFVWFNKYLLLLLLGSVQLWNVGKHYIGQHLQRTRYRRNLKQPTDLYGNFLTLSFYPFNFIVDILQRNYRPVRKSGKNFAKKELN